MKEVRSPYRLLHPRLVCLIVAKDSKTNVMALSWITPIEEKIIGISIRKRSYTYSIIKKTKEFTVNIPSKKMLNKVWIAGTVSGKDTDKLKLLKLELENGIKISTPHIKNCLGFLECKVIKKIPFEIHNFVIANIVSSFSSNFSNELLKEGSDILMHVGKKIFCTPSKYFKVKT